MNYFVTGATGFIGRNLVSRLLQREGTVYALVRAGSRGRLEELRTGWGADGARVVPIAGDLAQPGLGISEEDLVTLRGSVDHFFHLAAIYDMTADAETQEVANVEGTRYAVELAALRPDLVAGLVLIGPSLPVAPMSPERQRVSERFLAPAPEHPDDWERYNLAYWHAHYDDFAQWFFEELFPEPHSTKQIEDAVGWAAETDATILEAEARQQADGRPVRELIDEITCPTLVVHGDEDRAVPHDVGVAAARVTDGALVTFEGSGHMPNLRDPVRFNLLLREFAERVA